MNLENITINRFGWNSLSKLGCSFTIPFNENHFEHAQQILDPDDFIEWKRFKTVLCLASGGGQQSILFAKLGYDVTVLDISDVQLASDRDTALKFDLKVRCIQGDASDLSDILNERFDLVYQPVSTPYIPNIKQMCQHIGKILENHGLYYSEHFNPIWHQLPDGPSWIDGSYKIIREALPLAPITQTNWQINNKRIIAEPIKVYAHSYGTILGSICESNLKITKCRDGFLNCGYSKDAEPGSLTHISSFFPPIIRILAEKN